MSDLKITATLKDVAREAQVCPVTASRALNNRSTVRSYIKERVDAAVRKLDYQPNLSARTLRVNSSNLVTLGVDGLNNPFFGSLSQHTARHLIEAGFDPVILDKLEKVEQFNRAYQVKASIITYSIHDYQIMELCQRQKVITLMAGWGDLEHENYAHLYFDINAAYREMAHCVIGTGRSRPIFTGNCSVDIESPRYHYRYLMAEEVFQSAGIESGLTSGPDWVGLDDIRNLIERGTFRADTVLCENDLYAAKYLAMFNHYGINVPDDVLLIGCDGTVPLMDVWTIRLDIAQMADTAVEVLNHLLDDKESHRVVLETELFTPGYSP